MTDMFASKNKNDKRYKKNKRLK